MRAKLPVLSSREVIKAFGKAGFVFIRQRGSHIRLQKATTEGTLKITVPKHKVVKRRLLRKLIRDAGLTVEEFLELL